MLTVPCVCLLLLLTNLFHVIDAECTLKCPANSECVEEPADFSNHEIYDSMETMFVQHNTVTSNQHCICPPGLTGVMCDRPYEGCDGAHKCYNGGKCIPGLIDTFGNLQQFCDCSGAIDEEGFFYRGKYCEHKGLERCYKQNSFCVDEGKCNDAYPMSESPCICEEKFTGPHCEFKTGSVPECDLECNVGYCALGLQTPSQFHDLAHMFIAKEYQRCVCPQGFGGPNCDIQTVECGDSHCYHGATCVAKLFDTEILYHCDCTTASDDFGVKYAGRFCQFQSNTICTEAPTNNGVLFCVNGGTCKLDTNLLHKGCDCPAGVYGPSCEFVHFTGSEGDVTGNSAGNDLMGDPTISYKYPEDTDTDSDTFADYAECSLLCENNGTCRKGAKDLSFLGAALDAAYLNQSSDEHFEHCTCPENFVGLRCEHRLEICEAGKHVCLHGSKCVLYGDETGCDCSTASSFSLSSSDFAGASCQHPSTNRCTVGSVGFAEHSYFCVNGGKCKDYVPVSAVEPGCTCSDEWTGPHCELNKNFLGSYKETPVNAVTPTGTSVPLRAPAALPDAVVTTPISSSSSNGKGRVGFKVIIVLFSLFALIVCVYTLHKFSQRDHLQDKGMSQGTISTHATDSYPTFEEAYPSTGLSGRRPFRDPDSDAMSINLGLDENDDQGDLLVPKREERSFLHNVEIT